MNRKQQEACGKNTMIQKKTKVSIREQFFQFEQFVQQKL